MPFQIIRDDITKVKADAIVNTANPSVAVGDGVDRAIYEAAGHDELLAAREKLGELPPGNVGITPAFNLQAKYIIHSSGPWREGGSHGEEKLLRQCYDKALMLAYDYGCKTIAFPLMATGTYAFPKELGLQIAVDAFKDFLEDHEMDITLVVFTDYAYKVSGAIFEDVVSFVDGDTVKKTLSAEYLLDGVPIDEDFDDEEDELELSELDLGGPLDDSSCEDGDFAVFGARPSVCSSESISIKGSRSLDSVLKDIYTDSFEKHLQKLINKKGLKNSEVYAAANISKQYFSKLLKGQVKPSKEKVLALAVGLRLNLDETMDFLRLAGYALSPISQTDAVVEYFIENEDYNVLKIDIVLFDYGLEPLSNG
ncbi:macro domain-containing protein [Butyrivibrio sp. INlla14]|uniref:macro domain-containing protein n=1 Tax=Butyrivibrio sp. INlla14 TaxID=1520808 RepID=UPI00087740C8|nr:macro domain-containing protein [Butyrivibrio sp. INlla14]SCY63032.1 O-acetyl-ADP-ribose deacetylase (regulator of RNase III), contains Macro domain [Butyrivibrio sp. INlla14]